VQFHRRILRGLGPALAVGLAAGAVGAAPAGKGATRPQAQPAQLAQKAAAQTAPVPKVGPEKKAEPPPVPAFIVALPPAAPKDALRRLLLKPYVAVTGAALADTAWDGASLDALKGKPIDLALVDSSQLAAGCRSQILVHLDWTRLGRERFVPAAAADCGAGAYVAAIGLAWDKDKLNFTPQWTDFWDIARHPGRRGLQRTAKGNLEFALLADGVASGDVYRTLRTADGQDRAFRKLDQLKPYLTWWDKPDQPAQLLAAGKVLLTSAPASGVLAAAAAGHRHFGVQWAGCLTDVSFWAVPREAPHPGDSALALLVASDPARLAELAQATWLGPPTRDALALLPQAGRVAMASANLPAGVTLDDGFWAENQAKLEARFTAWLAK
jgi:putative spermidine/putrescine transport system substrate-binding protein